MKVGFMAGWGRARAIVICCVFLVVAFSPLVLASDKAGGSTPSLSLPNLHSKDKVKIDWNKNHFDWDKLKNNKTGDVAVIMAIDDSQLKSLDKKLQKEIVGKKNQTFNLGFEGISADLSPEVISNVLSENPNIQIQPDFTMNIQVNVNQTGADAMWNRTDSLGRPINGTGEVVAIIDTGISYNHPDLGAGFGPTFRVIGGYDFINADSDPIDDNGHGTHCAGIVGANGTIRGMAPDVHFLAYKVLNSGGSGPMSTVIQGIQRATDPNNDGDTSDHADVISMSLGGPGSPGDAISLASEAAMDLGVVVCVAAGNSGPMYGTVMSPGIAPKVVTVGAVDSSGVLASFSSRGMPTPYTMLKPEVSAPGVSIYSTYLYGGYATMSGTSMATPHVAGEAALILQAHPSWTPMMVKSAIVSGAHFQNDSLWNMGAGQIWVPGSADKVLFSNPTVSSVGFAFGVQQTININTTLPSNYTISTQDFHSLTGNYTLNGSMIWHTDSNYSSTNVSYINMVGNASDNIGLTVSSPLSSSPEGFYMGAVSLTNGTNNITIQFGYMVMSATTIHLFDLTGNDVNDPYGNVWLYRSDCNVTRWFDASVLGGVAPPVTFWLPSGDYTAHMTGHLTYYTYSDPYLLSVDFTVEKMTTKNVFVSLLNAMKFTLQTSDEGDHPILIRDLRVYFRHVGYINLSIDDSTTDYSLDYTGIWTAPKTRTFYVTPTNDTLGIEIHAYGFSDAMWNFFQLNKYQWYDNLTSNWVHLMPIGVSDMAYHLAWVFNGVTASTDRNLTINWSRAVAYQEKTDVLGSIYTSGYDPTWLDYGFDRAPGWVAEFWPQRDTGASAEPYFSGLNRTTIVMGAIQDEYFPMGLFGGIARNDYFTVDWNQLVSTTAANVYQPSRNFIGANPETTNASQRIGTGPIYPAFYFGNTNDTMNIYEPLFKLPGGERWDVKLTPTLKLYNKNSLQFYTGSMSEAVSVVPSLRFYSGLTDVAYHGLITATPSDIISNSFSISFGWRTPGIDVSPPRLTNFSMPQRFNGGDTISVGLESYDPQSAVSMSMWWRNGTGDSWHSISLTPGGYWFNGSIATGAFTAQVDLMVNVTDATGNYLNYTALNCALAQIPVTFNLQIQGGTPTVAYTNGNVNATILGNLSLTSNGSALSPQAGVPLDLYVGAKKVATILDSYIIPPQAGHNGTIRFAWNFNPIDIFTGPSESVNVTCHFDYGIYQSSWANFTLISGASVNIAPIVTLESPSNLSDIKAGQIIDLAITDERLAGGANYSVDGGANWALYFPYKVDTSNWSDGYHDLRITADDLNTSTITNYTFHVDNNPPVVAITYPTVNSTSLLSSATITATASDNNTKYLYWSIDGAAQVLVGYPYSLSVSTMGLGQHNVTLSAYDQFGNYAEVKVNFNITAESPIITNSPGTSGAARFEYSYNATCTPADSGVNAWTFITDAPWLNLNYSDQTHGYVNGITNAAGVYWANLSVADTDTSSYVNWTITISGSSPPPTITNSPNSWILEDHLYSASMTADQGVTWSMTTNASWLSSISPTLGTFSGTPNNAFSELDFYVNVTASNANGTASLNWTIHVWNLQPAFTPDVTIPPTVGSVGALYSFDANHSDENVGTPPGDFTAIDTNATGTYTFSQWGWLNWTPIQTGIFYFNITGNDERGVANSTNYLWWNVTVTEAPTILNTPDLSVTVWYVYSFNCSASPADSGANSWAFWTDAGWLSLVWSNQTQYSISGTPTSAGIFTANISVQDADSLDRINWTITAYAYAPSYTSGVAGSVAEDNYWSYQATANQTVTWALSTDATFLSITAGGLVQGTPNNSYANKLYYWNVTGTNPNGTCYSNNSFTVINKQPIITSSPNTACVNDTAYLYVATHSDYGIGGGNFTGIATNYSGAYTFVNDTLSFTASATGIFYFNLTADDQSGAANATNYQNWTVTISASSPLILNSAILIVVVWTFYWYNATGTAPDMGVNVWVFSTNATWLIEGNFGQLYKNMSGYPDSIGSFWVELSISDGDSSAYYNFTIDVIAGPAPIITSYPILGVIEDSWYFYLPTADQLVTWNLLWMDGTWIIFNPLNGSFTGLPDNSVSELGFNIWISATSMNGTSAVSMWQVFVYNAQANFTTSPGAFANVGTAYFYDPTTTDESVGTTVYTIATDFPGWYTIDATTGNLIFSPTAAGVFWFNITFDDFSGAANATINQNFTVTVLPLGILPPNPSAPGVVWPSFKFVLDGLSVAFSDNSYGAATLYVWDFGDGKGSSEKNPTHKYASRGIYTVTLTIIGQDNKSYEATARINVGQDLPITRTDNGWNVRLTDQMVLSISAIGLLVSGGIMVASATYFKDVPIVTRRGRYVIGFLMLLASGYYFLFLNNSWMGIG